MPWTYAWAAPNATYLTGLVREVRVPGLVLGGLNVELEERGGKPEDVVAVYGCSLSG